MGCGCGKRAKVAVTSVNEAELNARLEDEEQLRRDMQSLVAAVHNASAEVIDNTPQSFPI